MPFELSFDVDRRLVHVVGRGEPTLAERVAWVNRVVASYAPGSGFDVLIDVSEITRMPEAEDCGHIVKLMEKVQQHLGGRIAILNTRAGHATTSHLIAAFTTSGEVRAFTHAQRARTWLETGVS